MNYSLKKNKDGKVNALLKTGNDFVKTVLEYDVAEKIVQTESRYNSTRPGYPIHVGDWYFEGNPVPVKKGKKNEKDVLH